MKLNFISIIILSSFLISGLAVGNDGVIQGHIYNSVSGSPVSGVKVTLWKLGITNPDLELAGGYSDSDGYFELQTSWKGDTRYLTVEDQNYEYLRTPDFETDSEGDAKNLVLKIAPITDSTTKVFYTANLGNPGKDPSFRTQIVGPIDDVELGMINDFTIRITNLGASNPSAKIFIAYSDDCVAMNHPIQIKASDKKGNAFDIDYENTLKLNNANREFASTSLDVLSMLTSGAISLVKQIGEWNAKSNIPQPKDSVFYDDNTNDIAVIPVPNQLKAVVGQDIYWKEIEVAIPLRFESGANEPHIYFWIACMDYAGGATFWYDTNSDPASPFEIKPKVGISKKAATTISYINATLAGWNRTFGGSGEEGAFCIQPTSDSGYIIGGFNNSYAWLIKTDAQGNKMWDRTFGGSDTHSHADWVQQTSDGGYIIACDTDVGIGKAKLLGWRNYDIWLIKTDSQGNKLWDKTFNISDFDRALAVQQTSDNGYILGGDTTSFSNGNFSNKVWLIKTDSMGQETWNRTWAGDYSLLLALATIDSGYILAAATEKGNFSRLIKTDLEGREIWNRTSTNDAFIASVQNTPDGGYILAGAKSTVGAENSDGLLIKTDSEMHEIWKRTFGGAYSDWIYSAKSTFDRGYIIAGETDSYGAGKNGAWLIKTDREGREIWNRTFNEMKVYSINDIRASVIPTPDGGCILAGTTTMPNVGENSDVVLIKIDANGN